MAAGIFVVHTPAQAEDAGALVDLLESALALPDGAIACSSLPGYAWSSSGQPSAAEWDAMLQRVGAVIAIGGAGALESPQWVFDVAAAFGRGLWTVVLLDDATEAARLPVQLSSATLALRSDRESVRSVIEDVAFELGISPRLGKDTSEALSTFSSLPPAQPEPRRMPAHSDRVPLTTPSKPAVVAQVSARSVAVATESEYEALDTVPPPATGSARHSEPPAPFAPLDEPLELDDDELEPVDGGRVLVRRAGDVSCLAALDAGRAISECSFHRHAGGDFARELEQPFGSFIDAVGGDWSSLARIGDVEVWLGATDNLLDALPPDRHYVAEWYELGYQLSTLLSIAEHGGLDDPEQQETYSDLWGQAMRQFLQSGAHVGVAPGQLQRVRAQLENLVGPLAERDYKNVAATVQLLRELASAARARAPERMVS